MGRDIYQKCSAGKGLLRLTNLSHPLSHYQSPTRCRILLRRAFVLGDTQFGPTSECLPNISRFGPTSEPLPNIFRTNFLFSIFPLFYFLICTIPLSFFLFFIFLPFLICAFPFIYLFSVNSALGIYTFSP